MTKTNDFIMELEKIANKQETDIEELLSELEIINETEMFEQMLDDVFGEFDLCGYTYWSSLYFKEVDSIAYEEELLLFIDSKITDEEYFEYDGSFYDMEDVEELINDYED